MEDVSQFLTLARRHAPVYAVVFAACNVFLIWAAFSISTTHGFWETVFYVASRVAPANAVLIAVFVSIEGTLVGLVKKLIEKAEERGEKRGEEKTQRQIIQVLKDTGHRQSAEIVQDLIVGQDERRR
jgi:hypothetical protein